MEHGATAAGGGASILMPETIMVILTWVTFFILLIVLKQFAFKPIVEALKKREDDIRTSLENADKAKAQLANIEEEKRTILNEARSQASAIVEQARKTAKDLALDIEAKSKKQAQEIIQIAQNDITAERQKLLKSLRQESAQVAIELAGKIVKENMDTDKNRRLVEEAIKQI